MEIARALCVEPSLLLLDEPAAGMNAHETEAMARLIRSIRDSLAIPILLVEHDMGLVMGIADRVTVLDFGRRIADGTPVQVQQDPEVLRAYLGTSSNGDASAQPPSPARPRRLPTRAAARRTRFSPLRKPDMHNFLQLLIGGMSLGAVYALLALGFVVVFKAGGVVNFAHPALLMVGAYFISRFSVGYDVPFPVAVLVGVAIAVAIALLVERLLVRQMAGHAILAVSIMTIGVDVLVQTEVTRRIGIDVLPMGDPWGSDVVDVAGVTVPQTRLIALAVSVVIITGFLAWFRLSNWGVAMRATAEDPITASLMGIRRSRVSAVSWLIAGVLAAIAGLFVTVFPSPGLEPATAAVALRAFPAAIIGGLDSVGGAVIGGLVVGVTEALAQGYAEDLSTLGTGFHTVMPYLVMVLVLLVRPTGLFGTRELHRV